MNSLGSFATLFSGYQPVSKAQRDGGSVIQTLPAVGLRALRPDGEIDWSSLDQVQAPQHPKPEHSLRAWDVLIAARGSTAKLALLVRDPESPVYSSTNLIVMRADPALADPAYLWAFLSHLQQSPQNSYFTKATTDQWSITVRDLAKIPVPLPPLAEQRRIAAAVTAVRDAGRQARAIADQYDRLLSSLFTSTNARTPTKPVADQPPQL